MLFAYMWEEHTLQVFSDHLMLVSVSAKVQSRKDDESDPCWPQISCSDSGFSGNLLQNQNKQH